MLQTPQANDNPEQDQRVHAVGDGEKAVRASQVRDQWV